MNKQKLTIFMFLFFVTCEVSQAQNSFSVSNRNSQFMDLNQNYSPNPSNKISFEYSQWINYVTLTDPYDPAFSITVQLESVNKPKGLEMKVEAGIYKGMSKGDVGMPTGMLTVSQGARVLIDNITTCYTGEGRGEGHRTNLSFTAPENTKVDTAIYKVNVVYTLVQ